jgi:diguanylate cyclase (GGDEF)-like protein
MNDLYEENQNLRRQLKAFLTQARINEQKMQRFQAQELRLISPNSLVDLINVILNEYRTSFDLDIVTLVLNDPSFEIQHILEDEGVNLTDHHGLIFSLALEDLDEIYGSTVSPMLGNYTADKHAALFGHTKIPPASVALIPLIRYGELIGSMNLGSSKNERFVTGSGTDFLERLAAIVAISLENAANHERLKRVGVTDFLTAVNNRRFFDQRLVEEVTRLQRKGGPLTCLLLDIDNFKGINDNNGHLAGDIVLKDTAALIRKQLRCSDVLARYGGEEFVALLIDTPESTALDIAERIRAGVAAHISKVKGVGDLQVTISIGLATFGHSDDEQDAALVGEKLVDCADKGLYRAKNSGKDKVVVEQQASYSDAINDVLV